ncbi:MAG: hypothetical protein M3Q30_01715 [Actinomycetota bacterium]|nr:hypothetical protein [Actinomycetota bacterium]
MNLLQGIGDFFTSPFRAAAGWAWDTVIGGITNWLAKGFVQLVTFVWSLMDRASSPRLDAEWFSGRSDAPYVTAIAIAALLLTMFLFCALIQGVMTGRPIELVRRMFRDTPAAIAGILLTAAVAQIGIQVTDEFSNGVWQATRQNAVTALDGLGRVAITLSPATFLTPLVLGVGMIALLMLWIVLIVRESLIYVVVALSPLAWATSVWPAIAGVRRRCLELLAGLIVSKLAIAIALSVGIGALGGIGATGRPGDPVAANGLAEFSTLVAGIVTFGIAAFMPFVVMRLLPIVEGAVIAQGVSSAPGRGAQQAMQYSYYTQHVTSRLAGDGAFSAGATRGGQRPITPTGSSPASSPTVAPTPAAAAAGPVAAAAVGVGAARAVAHTAQQVARDATAPGSGQAS